jgi:hypothetical protein
MLVGVLASLALASGRQSEWSSTSDRNHEQSLGVTEAGLNQVVGRIGAQAATPPASGPNYWAMAAGTSLPSSCPPASGRPAVTCSAAQTDSNYSASTPQGKYWYWVNRCGPGLTPALPCPGDVLAQGFIVDVQGTTGVNVLKRGRHIQATLTPPARFSGDTAYALFSNTTIVVQDNDQVRAGNIFANESILLSNSNTRPTLQGSVTSATGWVELGSGVQVTGSVWSGGYNATASPPWAINLGGGAEIDGWAMASVSNPTDPTTCGNEVPANYNVPMANASVIKGDLTTLGTNTGPGVVQGQVHHTCTAATPRKDLPPFNPADYGTPTTFNSVAAFQGWMYCNGGLTNLQGTFVVNESAPAQTGNGTNCGNETSYHRIDLTGALLKGPLTIITNAPIYTGSLDDSQVPCPQTPCNSTLVLVSHYAPPASNTCSTTSDTSECAIHLKNNFSLNAAGTCKTATLAYADLGAVAIKNGGTLCGSVVSDSILVKNGETVTYDLRIDHILGFGLSAYAITRWEELPAR